MRERFNTDDDDAAVLFVNDVLISFESLSYRAEGVSPGDCRRFFETEEAYDRMQHAVRPDHEYMVFEIECSFGEAGDQTTPLLFERIEAQDRTCTLSFECEGHEIQDVDARLEGIDDHSVILVGTYGLGMP